MQADTRFNSPPRGPFPLASLIYSLALALLGLVLAGQAMAQGNGDQRWEAPSVSIHYDPAGSPLSVEEVSTALRYAAASWQARTGLALHFEGQGPQDEQALGSIGVRWQSPLQVQMANNHLLGFAATRKWVYQGTQELAKAEIWLNTALWQEGGPCFTHTVLHELGHALGIPHVDSSHGVMYAQLHECHHSLTFEDISVSPYQQHGCHGEILQGNHDIQVPIINLQGRSFSGTLRFLGDQQWRLDPDNFREIPFQGHCQENRMQGQDLELQSLWQPQGSWNLHLEHSGIGSEDWQWRLAPQTAGE